MNPIMLQAIKNLAQRQGNDVVFVVGPPPDDPERIKFLWANVNVWDHFEAEAYWLLDQWGMNYGAEHLNEWQAAGDTVIVYVNAAHCDVDEIHSAAFDPSADADHWLEWRNYVPGTLLQSVKQNHPERIKKLDPEAPLHWSYVDPPTRAAELERQRKFLTEIERQHRTFSEQLRQGANLTR